MVTESSTLRSPSFPPTTANPARDFAPGLEKAFPPEFEEWEGEVECVAGKIPKFVRGSYYLNGPARFQAGDVRYHHWLDGDGMVSRLHFDAGGIHFRNRYIQSTKFVEEQKAGRTLFRTFGTSFSESRLNRVNNRLESPVNISVYPYSNRLLAFGEQGLPWQLDPETLETVGQFTLNGRLNDASPMAAHAKFDPGTGEMFNFGVFFSDEPKLYVYCIDPEGLRYRKSFPLPYPCTVHDFALSERYAIFYLSPYLLDLRGFLENGATVMESLHWEPDCGSRLIIVDRRSGELVASISIGDRYCLHLINSFERDGRVILDVLEFDAPIYGQYQQLPNLFSDVAHGGPVRFVIDLDAREVERRIALNYSLAPDFPAIDARRAMQPYDEFWMLGISTTGSYGRKFFDQLVHASWKQNQELDIYQSPPHFYLAGEPVFIGEPGSANGVILCQEFDAQNAGSYFLLFAAHKVSAGPVARIALKKQLYLGFHAVFKAAEEPHST